MSHEGDEWEAQRQRNIAANRELLRSLGLENPIIPSVKSTVKPTARKVNKAAPKPALKRKVVDDPSATPEVGEPAPKNLKRLRRDSPDSENTEIQLRPSLGPRRSTRNLKRVSYTKLAAMSSSPDSSDEDENFELEAFIVKKPRRGYSSEAGSRDIDDTKQRRVPKVGDREHSP
jgi:hypothetical protein